MLDFNQYLARHGEFGVQAILEQIERIEGLCTASGKVIPLELRWQHAMQGCDVEPSSRLAA